MQRATYLAHLCESIGSIPPDIQHCLLTIAQFGCDPEQVTRWYTIVRNHFSSTGPESPINAPPRERMPPPRTPQRLTESAGQMRPISSNSRAPASSYQVPALGPELEISPASVNMTPRTPLMPWPTPDTSRADHFNIDQGTVGLAGPTTPFGNYSLDHSPDLSMAALTGSGLVPAPESDMRLPSGPKKTSPYDFILNRPAMPVFIRFEDNPVQSPRNTSSGNVTSAAPPSVVSPSQDRPSTAGPARKRPRLASTQRKATAAEPPPRPSRPAVPFRQAEQFPQYPAIAPKVETSPSQPFVEQSPLAFAPTSEPQQFPLHDPFWTIPSTQPPHQQDEGGYGPFQTTDQQAPPYHSPYT